MGPQAKRVLRWLARLPIVLYDHDLGWLLGRRFLMLTHVGRRSGRRYRTVLEVIGAKSDSAEVMVMVGLGRSADWYRNILAQPMTDVAIGRERFRAVYRELGDEEAAALLAAYERRNRALAVVIRQVLSRLVGWRYDGTPDQRLRLVRERPVIAFRPAGHS